MPEHTYKGIIDLARKWIVKEKEKERKGVEDKGREDDLKVVVRSIQDKEIGRKRKTAELRDDELNAACCTMLESGWAVLGAEFRKEREKRLAVCSYILMHSYLHLRTVLWPNPG